MKWLCPSAVPGTAVPPQVSPPGTGGGVPGQPGAVPAHGWAPRTFPTHKQGNKSPKTSPGSPSAPAGARSCPGLSPGLAHLGSVTCASWEQGTQECHSPAPSPASPHPGEAQNAPRAPGEGVHPLHFLNISSCEQKPSPVQLENKSAPHSSGDLQHTVFLICFSVNICGFFLTQLHSRLIFLLKTPSHAH